MKKILLSLILSAVSCSTFADVDVIDDSQSYAYNDVSSKKAAKIEKENSAFVVSDNEQLAHPLKKGASKLQLLFAKIESLQQEIAELRGRVEIQEYQLERAGLVNKLRRKGNKMLMPNVDIPKSSVNVSSTVMPLSAIDKPIKKPIAQVKNEVIAKQQPVAAVDTTKEAVSSDPMDEQLSYVAAYEHVKHKRYQEAIPAMQKFITSYPDGPYVANAHYWLGELYGVNGDYDKALAEFKIVISEYSDSNKLSAAQYKLGVIYEKIGEKELAQSEFIKVTEAFPGTAIARLAKAKLK